MRVLAAGLLSATLALAACGGDDESGSAGRPTRAAIEPADYTAKVDNPLFPLSSVRFTVSRGTERDPKTHETTRTRVENRVLSKRTRVAGVTVTIVDFKEYEDGELVEHTSDYFAQHRDGSVWYFGEKVDNYENGKLVDHEGSWLAGQRGARPGLFMPARPKPGESFDQERAPGIAEDRSTVVDVGLKVKVPAGSFSGCIRTKDFSPLDKVTEFKNYCPKVGLVRETEPGVLEELVSYR
jgi:hypothetical protein